MAKFHSTDKDEPIIWLFLPYDCFYKNDFYYAALDYVALNKVRFIVYEEAAL